MSVVVRARWSRWAVVVAVVLGVFCGPAVLTASAGPASGPTSVQPTFVADTPTPGCRPHTPSDGVGQPATPVRQGTPYELMPALFEARGGDGGWSLGRSAGPVAAGRAPPSAGPPTPVDLSVLLRV
ncbi:hypothetical protein ACH4SP_12630 [Streptomyces sp. NPDC021093]|uniref:hypothetical protein n=1 Tax=Streptomyces sp. NPDC021093 TaxID=3365112 RepID=UPI0037A69F5B